MLAIFFSVIVCSIMPSFPLSNLNVRTISIQTICQNESISTVDSTSKCPGKMTSTVHSGDVAVRLSWTYFHMLCLFGSRLQELRPTLHLQTLVAVTQLTA